MGNNVTTAIAAAESQLGVQYVFGGESPKGSAHPGFDCSGLMQWSFEQAGMSIPRTTQTQWLVLPHVQTPGPGDLILFDVPSDGPPQPQHVGMYLGPNRMIEAPHTGTVVKYSPIPNIPGETIMGYCRVRFPMPRPPAPPVPVPPIPEETILTSLIDAEGHIHLFAASPGNHLLHFESGLSNAAEGWSVTDVTDAIKAISGTTYTVAT